ncbi:MAG: four helix bundle protein [Phycisphaerae bacterium]|nr:four helix bundle protein [Phycisphaerae bacterium]
MTVDYRELVVWQKSIELAKVVYRLTQRMPESERFGLTNQMRRASVSIPSNIAEGNARQSRRDYLHFLTIARGSLAELETQVTIAEALELLPRDSDARNRIAEIGRILQGLIRSLQPAR